MNDPSPHAVLVIASILFVLGILGLVLEIRRQRKDNDR
jgi:NADH:ubiquinone oxidoreductase subunit K